MSVEQAQNSGQDKPNLIPSYLDLIEQDRDKLEELKTGVESVKNLEEALGRQMEELEMLKKYFDHMPNATETNMKLFVQALTNHAQERMALAEGFSRMEQAELQKKKLEDIKLKATIIYELTPEQDQSLPERIEEGGTNLALELDSMALSGLLEVINEGEVDAETYTLLDKLLIKLGYPNLGLEERYKAAEAEPGAAFKAKQKNEIRNLIYSTLGMEPNQALNPPLAKPPSSGDFFVGAVPHIDPVTGEVTLNFSIMVNGPKEVAKELIQRMKKRRQS